MSEQSVEKATPAQRAEWRRDAAFWMTNPGNKATIYDARILALCNTLDSLDLLVAEYAEERHSDECGFGACVRCVVDEFASRLSPAEPVPCDGSGRCPAPLHVHGCYADLDGSACDDPSDHPASSTSETPTP